MNWLRVSLIAQGILALYFQVIQWFPLGNWGYQPGNPPLSVLAAQGRLPAREVFRFSAFVVPFTVFWFAYSRGLRWRRLMRWLMWDCAAFYALSMALHIKSWWVPYLFGATDAQVERYQRVFAQGTQLLPSFGRHLPPDGMHLVLGILIASALIPAVAGLVKTSSPAKPA